jgi:general secretion pathway protein A
MYLHHFGLDQNPFSLTPDPRFLFLTAEHREALAALLFAVTQQKGFMVMTGEAGTGKTTLIKKLLLSIPATCAHFCVIVNPALTRSELLEYILLDFGERDIPASKALRLALLHRLLLKAHAERKTSVLVIDEAHLLTAELIEEVRLLSNFETSEQKLIQIILAGQNEFDTTLHLDSMRQLRQRIAVRAHIGPLAQPEVKKYVQKRWTRASSEARFPFSEEALSLIAESCGGIPRVINAVCDAALVNACGSGTTHIDTSEIREVLRDMAMPDPLDPHSVPASPACSISSYGFDETHKLKSGAAVPMLERHASGKQRAANIWKFATWCGVARSGVE